MAVAEAAVVGVADELTGQIVNAFVSLKEGYGNTTEMRGELIKQVRKSIGPFAAPKVCHFYSFIFRQFDSCSANHRHCI